MAMRRMLINSGKLNTAMRMLLLFAFDEMPEIRLNEEAKPMDVRHKVRKKV